MDAEGKTALITGGARIGGAVAEALARRGADVAVTYRRSKGSAEEAIRRVRRQGARGAIVKADLTREADLRRVISTVKKSFGRLDILINMASIYHRTPLESLGSRPWRANMEANLKSAYLLSLLAAPLLKRRGQGRIINISDWVSASGRPRYKGFLPYYVSKTGMIGLTEALALELAPRVLVNAIAPGPILQPAGMTGRENREVLRETPLSRWGGAEEIAKAVLFLIEADFITGECIRVDGGRHLR